MRNRAIGRQGRRTISLTASNVDLLTNIPRSTSELVFPGKKGDPIKPDILSRLPGKIAKKGRTQANPIPRLQIYARNANAVGSDEVLHLQKVCKPAENGKTA